MVGVSASVNVPLHHKGQKFSSGTGSPEWSGKKGCKTVVVVHRRFGMAPIMHIHNFLWGYQYGTKTVQVTPMRSLLPNPNVLVAISKGMRALKLCSNKIFQFLTAVPTNAGCVV